MHAFLLQIMANPSEVRVRQWSINIKMRSNILFGRHRLCYIRCLVLVWWLKNVTLYYNILWDHEVYIVLIWSYWWNILYYRWWTSSIKTRLICPNARCSFVQKNPTGCLRLKHSFASNCQINNETINHCDPAQRRCLQFEHLFNI